MSAESRLNDAVRLHLLNDGYNHWFGIAEELCKLAHHKKWQKSQHWTPYQSVVFHLADLIKDWLEEKTEGEYSLINTIVMTARAWIDYEYLARVFIDDAVEILIYDYDRYSDITDYLGLWDFQEWLVSEAAKAYDHYTEDELEESIDNI